MHEYVFPDAASSQIKDVQRLQPCQMHKSVPLKMPLFVPG